MLLNQSTEQKFKVTTDHFKSMQGDEKIFYKIIMGRPSIKSLSIILLHDLADYHLYQNNFLGILQDHFKQELTVGCFDYKGHGLSSGTRGHISQLSELTDDLFYFIEEVFPKFLQKDEKYFIVAPGLSGLCLLRLLQTKEEKILKHIRGLIFINPLIKIQLGPPNWIYEMIEKWENYLGKVRFPLPKSEEIENNLEIISKQGSDPLYLNSISLSFLGAILKESEILRKSSFFYDGPTLFLTSGQDVMADHHITNIFHKGLGKKYSTLTFYKEMKHDILNDENANLAFVHLIEWIEKCKNDWPLE